MVSISAGHSRELDFGNWKFWIVAWASDENGHDLVGLTQCDFQSANIDQSSIENVEVIFSLSNGKCAGSEFISPGTETSFTTTGFGGPLTHIMFPDLAIKNCRNLADSTGYGDDCLAQLESGYFSSYKVIFPIHEGFAHSGIGLESECVQEEDQLITLIPLWPFLQVL